MRMLSMRCAATAAVVIRMIRTYSELIALKSFKERFAYLKLDGKVGEDTFAWDRYLNQQFYSSKEWKRIRRDVIVRDHGCDLAHPDFEISGRIIIHHMNVLTAGDIINQSEFLTNPEYLISVAPITHNAIHYGDESLLMTEPIVRTKNDTCPWRK